MFNSLEFSEGMLAFGSDGSKTLGYFSSPDRQGRVILSTWSRAQESLLQVPFVDLLS